MSSLPSLLPAPPAFRPLGSSSLIVSPIAWGSWRLASDGRNADDAARLVHAALDAGITLFDTADIYGYDSPTGFGSAERLLGQVLRAEPGLRQRMVLATKGGIRAPCPYDQSPAYLAEAIDGSLQRLGVDCLDLWQVHRPDILAHPHETAAALDKAVGAGKIRELGVSNFTTHQTAALAHFLGQRLVATQPEISPLRITALENGEMDAAMTLGLTPLAWSPLAGGRLFAPENPRETAVADALDAFAGPRGISRTVAAYSWLMAHPAGIIPIIGSQNPARIAEGAQAIGQQWSRQEWYAVLVAARGEPLP